MQPKDFEDEVRRVARELWPYAEFGGARIEENLERDGVFETEWMTHIVEATISSQKAKAKKDIDKLVKLRRKLQQTNRPVIGWFVTQKEPTADQRALAPKDGSVTVLSFEQFRSKLVDANGYLRDRSNYPFGSARDPETGSPKVRDEYIPLGLLPIQSGQPLTVTDAVGRLDSGGRLLLVGEFGTGKSMTLRELHSLLTGRFRSTGSSRFPIHINLRDHHGQTDPSEALGRHARNVGFANPNQLIRGWRAGYVHLLLDGFDELATPGWAGPVLKLPDIRRKSVELIRRFIRETPAEAGIAVAGRRQFFDSPGEMSASLGLTSNFVHLQLDEFTDSQINTYLQRRGWKHPLPDWLPSRPLLLGYLASRGLLMKALEVSAGSAPAAAWDSLLQLICDREAEIEATIDGAGVRLVVERLASLARQRSEALGPLHFADIEQSFREIAGYTPDDRALVLLQRLPGLGPMDEQDGTRRFVDADLADTAAAGEVFRFAMAPHDSTGAHLRWKTELGQLGIEALVYKLSQARATPAHVAAALREAASLPANDVLVMDLARCLIEMGGTLTGGHTTQVSEVIVQELDLSETVADIRDLVIRDSLIFQLKLPRDGMPEDRMPIFQDCHFGSVEGRTSERDLPASKFVRCSFDQFTEGEFTSDRILATSLPVGTRVSLTVLKKLYAQRGRGRKEGALYRGMGPSERSLVEPALEVLERAGLAIKTKAGREVIWLPNANGRPSGVCNAGGANDVW
jgi:hypothetical protein